MIKKMFFIFLSTLCFANDFITLNRTFLNSEKSFIEIFSYRCIHCYNHHQFGTLEKLKKSFPHLTFKLYPASIVHGEFAKELNELFAFAQYKDEKNARDASDKNSLSYKLVDVYYWIHFVNQRTLNNLDEFYNIGLRAMDVSKNEVLEFLKSPRAGEILEEFQKANDIVRMHGTPSFIVNGRYQIKASAIASIQDLEEIVKKLSSMP